MNLICGVVASAVGSFVLLSNADPLGVLNVYCGILKVYEAEPKEDPGFSVTMTCESGLYSCITKSSGMTGCGAGGTPLFCLISCAERVGCVQLGLRSTSPKRTSDMYASNSATA